MHLIATTVENSSLSINNATGNTVDLIITPTAGGKRPVSAQLIIKQIG